MFPIEQADLRDRILHEIVPAYLMDKRQGPEFSGPTEFMSVRSLPRNRSIPRAGRLLALRPGTTPPPAICGWPARPPVRTALRRICKRRTAMVLNGELHEAELADGNGVVHSKEIARRSGSGGQN